MSKKPISTLMNSVYEGWLDYPKNTSLQICQHEFLVSMKEKHTIRFHAGYQGQQDLVGRAQMLVEPFLIYLNIESVKTSDYFCEIFIFLGYWLETARADSIYLCIYLYV